jgi:hypothetical protein
MNNLDQDLVRVFTMMRQPADRIACFTSLREKFLSMLSEETRQRLTDDQLIWSLLQVRKGGKLPAIHREVK